MWNQQSSRISTARADTFGAQLKRYRRAARLTQERLAERAGYSAVFISKLEQGERNPLPDTVDQLANVLDLDPTQRAALHAAAWRVRQPTVDIVPTDPAPLPFTGRTRELAWLDKHLSDAHPAVLAVGGQPGIGKTRLLQEVVGRAKEHALTVLWGGCHRRSDLESFAPIVDALMRYVMERRAANRRINWQGCAWLVRLLPELQEVASVPSPTWTPPPHQERRLMFDAVARFLANVAGPDGTLLVLDDLQWAGVDALDLLATLVRARSGKPLQVVVAYRDTEVNMRHPLGAFLADLTRDDLALRCELGPLTGQESGQLLSNLFQQDGVEQGRDELIGRVLGRAGGVPYFLVSCARELREETLRSGQSQAVGAVDTVPWTVAESIRQRVAALPETAEELLRIAAVMGRRTARVALLDVAARSGLDEREALAGLEACGQGGLLVEEGNDGYRFTHDLIHEAIMADLSMARRVMLHRRVAETLEHLLEHSWESQAAELAYHYLEAGDEARALPHVFQAARQAERAFAHSEAERHIRTALRLARKLGDYSHEREALERLGDILELTSHHDEARAAYEEAIATDIAAPRETIEHAQLHRKVALTYTSQRRLLEAAEAYDRAESALGSQPTAPAPEWWRLWLDITIARMQLNYWLGKPVEMRVLAERIQPAIERHGSLEQRADFLIALSEMCFRRDGNVVTEETLAYAKSAYVAAQESGGLRVRADVEEWLAFARLWHGDLDEAEAHYHATLALAERVPSGNVGDYEMICQTYLAFVHRLRGQVEEAERCAERALAVATAQEMPEYLASAQANLAWVAWRRGELAEAERLGQESLERWQRFQMYHPLQWAARWPLIAAEWRQDRLSQAIEAARMIFSPKEQPLPDTQASHLEAAIHAWDAGEPEQASARLMQAMALARDTGYL